VTNDALDIAYRMAITILDASASPDMEDLERALDGAIEGARAMGHADIDRDALRRWVEESRSIFVGTSSTLADDSDHQPWLDRRRGEIDWRFWEAYRRWQLARGLGAGVTARLDEITDDVLGRLEDPERSGGWDRRGLIVGQVQSGKTSNYTGLICKAADAGYKLIVVLAGLHNSLRSQTQHRLDEGFLGLDSRTFILNGARGATRHIGVGVGGARHPAAWTMTSSEERGDFNRRVAGQIAGRLGGDPVLLVVKKNASVLRNLIEWITTANGRRDPETGRLIVGDLPVLVIDDEADNASVNTREIDVETDEDGNVISETDPTTINRLIRQLLHSFEQRAYVGYTATPFANIFIDEPEAVSPAWGEDLFPRSFIVRIPPPSNYVGPVEVFGISAADDPQGTERDPQPVIRFVADTDDWLPIPHRKDFTPGALPPSLHQAIRSFLLVCAARAARGDRNVHNSMLVHVTHYVAVQGLVSAQISDELITLKDRLRYGDGSGAAQLRDELRGLWERDFIPTSKRMAEAPPDWSAVDSELADAAARVRVLEINGSAGEVLEYIDHPDGVSVIAVGGNKLSRGLTLEGLSVSYYLRASKMYDTLMQMGRWFGYRPGYVDLCRLYTTAELVDYYRDITVANEELLAKFDEMAAVNGTPKDFALYVRTSPSGLLVTARAKMRSGRVIQLSYSGDVTETINFVRDAGAQNENLAHLGSWLIQQVEAGRSHRRSERGGNLIWERIPGEEVARLLDGWRTAPNARRALTDPMAKYIRARLRQDELSAWTVAVINNTTASVHVRLAGERVGLTTRALYPPGSTSKTYDIRRLLSPTDERLDLSADELERALRDTLRLWEQGGIRTAQRPTAPNGPAVRRVRPPQRGLLLLYLLDPAEAPLPGVEAIPALGVSFPESPNAQPIEYMIPARYWEDFIAS
jgi:hypothetical protein